MRGKDSCPGSDDTDDGVDGTWDSSGMAAGAVGAAAGAAVGEGVSAISYGAGLGLVLAPAPAAGVLMYLALAGSLAGGIGKDAWAATGCPEAVGTQSLGSDGLAAAALNSATFLFSLDSMPCLSTLKSVFQSIGSVG